MKKNFSKQVLFYSFILFSVVLLINFSFLLWMHQTAEANKFDLLTKQLGAGVRPYVASQVEVSVRSQLKNVLNEPSILAIIVKTDDFKIVEQKGEVEIEKSELFSDYLWASASFPIYENSDQKFYIKVAYENKLARKTFFDALVLSGLFLFLIGFIYWVLVSRIVTKETLEIEKSNMAKRIFHVLKSEFIPLINLEDEGHFQNFSNKKKRLMRLSFYQRILGSISKFITFEGAEYYSLEEYKAISLKQFLDEFSDAKKIEYVKREHVDLTIKSVNDEIIVKTIPRELWHALSNLVNNAYEAVDEKGEINISVNTIDKDLVEIIVKDNGKGIPQSEIQKIFTEGYSYRKKKGNGIGLPQAINKIRNLGGEIVVESEEGVGTKVSITLIAESKTKLDESGVDLILIDDALNRRINAEEMAKESGYTMLSFGSYDECINHLRKYPQNLSIPIYGDSEMCDGKPKGEFRLRELFSIGYTNITVVTGAEDSEIREIKSLPWIKNVIPKDNMGSDYTELLA